MKIFFIFFLKHVFYQDMDKILFHISKLILLRYFLRNFTLFFYENCDNRMFVLSQIRLNLSYLWSYRRIQQISVNRASYQSCVVPWLNLDFDYHLFWFRFRNRCVQSIYGLKAYCKCSMVCCQLVNDEQFFTVNGNSLTCACTGLS